MFERISVVTLGENKGAPRLYLEASWLRRAGFAPDVHYSIEVAGNAITLRLDPDGDRKVSGKRNRTIPVIDLNSRELAEIFGSARRIQITGRDGSIEISPARTAQLAAARRFSLTEGSLFSGAGFLTEASRSLGFAPKFGVEISPDYAETYEANHPTSKLFNCSVEEVPFEELRRFAPLGLLTLGIPCEPYSKIRTLNKGGQEKRDRSLPPEAHDLGDMVYWAIRAIEATNPSTIVVENVPGFLESGARHILENVLRRLGYHVDARIIDPIEYGELTSRKRAILIARADAPVVWPEPKPATRTLAEILDPADRGEWFDRESKPWLFEHWDKQAAKGNGFPSQIVSASSPRVGTIKKRYFAQQGDNPVVAHPTKDGVVRWFTLDEVKRLHGIREDYILPEAKTVAGEMIGQGVVVSTMRELIAANLPADAVASCSSCGAATPIDAMNCGGQCLGCDPRI